MREKEGGIKFSALPGFALAEEEEGRREGEVELRIHRESLDYKATSGICYIGASDLELRSFLENTG